MHSETSVLQAQLERVLHDLYCEDEFLVYADMLSEIGDPRGEFIVLEMLSEPNDKQQRRMSVLQRRHLVEFTGPLAAITLRNSWVFSWGFLSSCTFAKGASLQPALEHPLARFLEVIDFERGIDDIGPLALLTGLRDLDLHGCRMTDLAPIAGLPHLTELSLYGGEVKNLEPLAKLTKLTSLTISGCRTTDLLPILDLPELTVLTFRQLSRIEDLGLLTSLTGLETLDMSESYIEDAKVEELRDALPGVEIYARPRPPSSA